jgi:REP element-mobilizing transposase RayT
MKPSAGTPFRFFEPRDEYFVLERKHLPHWAQPGTISFLTWRTWDSMPRDVLASWVAERDAWLVRHGIDPASPDWRDRVACLGPAEQRTFHEHVSARWEACLDECHGACVLRRPELAQVVADSLHHFDGQRYFLTDFVVMPNHVHVLVAFPSAEQMLAQCDSWKHYTAVKINWVLQRRGRFWEPDAFDHLVRSAEQFEHLRRYIQDSPANARLRQGEFIHYSRQLL